MFRVFSPIIQTRWGRLLSALRDQILPRLFYRLVFSKINGCEPTEEKLHLDTQAHGFVFVKQWNE